MVDYPLYRVCVRHKGRPRYYSMDLRFTDVNEWGLAMLNGCKNIAIKNGINPGLV